MYHTCLCPNLVSVHFYAIPILHFKFPKFFIIYITVDVATLYVLSPVGQLCLDIYVCLNTEGK